MNYFFEQGEIKAGNTAIFNVFGSGLTWEKCFI